MSAFITKFCNICTTNSLYDGYKSTFLAMSILISDNSKHLVTTKGSFVDTQIRTAILREDNVADAATFKQKHTTLLAITTKGIFV